MARKQAPGSIQYRSRSRRRRCHGGVVCSHTATTAGSTRPRACASARQAPPVGVGSRDPQCSTTVRAVVPTSSGMVSGSDGTGGRSLCRPRVRARCGSICTGSVLQLGWRQSGRSTEHDAPALDSTAGSHSLARCDAGSRTRFVRCQLSAGGNGLSLAGASRHRSRFLLVRAVLPYPTTVRFPAHPMAEQSRRRHR